MHPQFDQRYFIKNRAKSFARFFYLMVSMRWKALTPKSAKDEMQLSIFNLDDPLLEEIKEEIVNLDINTLTPVEALMKLNEIKRMLGKK